MRSELGILKGASISKIFEDAKKLDALFLYLWSIIALAAFTQSVSGFGSALVAMALLPLVISIHQAVPLVTLMSLTLEIILLRHYRSAINLRALRRVLGGSLLGIPFGLYLLRGVDEASVLRLLGIVLVAYAVYALLKLRLPAFAHPRWGWLFGFAAGLLGGAYNTSGPPMVIYGQSQNWGPDEFKANLQSFFLVNNAIVTLGHAMGGNLTPSVWNYFLLTLPALALGIFVGLKLNYRIDALRFRQIVQVLLIGLGLRLIFA